jgi:hypothetical protein
MVQARSLAAMEVPLVPVDLVVLAVVVAAAVVRLEVSNEWTSSSSSS